MTIPTNLIAKVANKVYKYIGDKSGVISVGNTRTYTYLKLVDNSVIICSEFFQLSEDEVEITRDRHADKLEAYELLQLINLN
jgi:hypothetical protein